MKTTYKFVNVIGDNLVEIKISADNEDVANQLLEYVAINPKSFHLMK